jgi:hypothetical protein
MKTAFQGNAFQNNAFQIVSAISAAFGNQKNQYPTNFTPKAVEEMRITTLLQQLLQQSEQDKHETLIANQRLSNKVDQLSADITRQQVLREPINVTVIEENPSTPPRTTIPQVATFNLKNSLIQKQRMDNLDKARQVKEEKKKKEEERRLQNLANLEKARKARKNGNKAR